MSQAGTLMLLSADAGAGRGVLVAATATTGTTIHTGVSGTSSLDKVWLYAMNSHSAAVVLTIEWDRANGAETDNTVLTIQPNTGRVLVLDGKIINNGKLVTAFAATTNVISLTGEVNRVV